MEKITATRKKYIERKVYLQIIVLMKIMITFTILIGEYGVTSWYGNVQTQFDSNNQPVGTTYHPVLKDTYDNALMRK